MADTAEQAAGAGAGAGAGADAGAGAGAGGGTFFEEIKTSLPGLDIFDPSVFDMKKLIGALVCFGLLAVMIYRLFVKKVVGEDDFFSDLGISYADFELPDEIDEYYQRKEETSDKEQLRRSLLKRAIADIPIILRMQQEGPGMYNMYQQAMIGEREWRAFQSAEAVISEEIESVQEEADIIDKGWSQNIWPLAMQLRQVLVQRQAHQDAKKAEDEKQAALAEEAKKAAIEDGAKREKETAAAATPAAAAAEAAAPAPAVPQAPAVEAAAAAPVPALKAKSPAAKEGKGSKGSSKGKGKAK